MAATSFRIDPALKKKMRQACIDHATTQTVIVNEGIQLWLERQGVEGSSKLVQKTDRGRNQAWHDMLDDILANKEERVGIEKNLQWAVSSMRKGEPQKAAPIHPTAALAGPKKQVRKKVMTIGAAD